MHLIASNRSVRICANPAIVDGAPRRRSASRRDASVASRSPPRVIGYLCEGSSIFYRVIAVRRERKRRSISLSRSLPIFTNDEIKCRPPIQIANTRAIYLITTDIRENL